MKRLRAVQYAPRRRGQSGSDVGTDELVRVNRQHPEKLDQPIARLRIGRIRDARRAVRDDRPIVGVGDGRAEKRASARGPATKLPRTANSSSSPRRRASCGNAAKDRRFCTSATSNRSRVDPTDEPDHGRLEAVRRDHGETLRIDRRERAHDAAQRLEIELVQRQPLAKHAARIEPPAHGLEMLHRVQRSRAAPRRMEVVRHDHVETPSVART